MARTDVKDRRVSLGSYAGVLNGKPARADGVPEQVNPGVTP